MQEAAELLWPGNIRRPSHIDAQSWKISEDMASSGFITAGDESSGAFRV